MADNDGVASDSGGAVARGAPRHAGPPRPATGGGRPGHRGWKIGFNSPVIQEHFGLSEPVVGYLLDAGVVADGATVAVADWVAPAVEVEVAIRVGDDGGVAGLAPALELVDLDMPFDGIEPVLADNICQRGVVFGDEVPGADPWAMVATVTRAGGRTGVGEVVAEGRITEDPAQTVAFVRTFLAAHGAALEPGDRIIAGSVVAPIAVAPGDELHVDFGPAGRPADRLRLTACPRVPIRRLTQFTVPSRKAAAGEPEPGGWGTVRGSCTSGRRASSRRRGAPRLTVVACLLGLAVTSEASASVAAGSSGSLKQAVESSVAAATGAGSARITVQFFSGSKHREGGPGFVAGLG